MRTNYVYVISEGKDGPVKIGHSISPEMRCFELQVGNPRPIRVVWKFLLPSKLEASRHEKEAHVFLGDIRLSSEWFDMPETTAIAAVSACMPSPAA